MPYTYFLPNVLTGAVLDDFPAEELPAEELELLPEPDFPFDTPELFPEDELLFPLKISRKKFPTPVPFELEEVFESLTFWVEVLL